jgi:hypothetical protein
MTVYHADIVEKLTAVVANDQLRDSMVLEFSPPDLQFPAKTMGQLRTLKELPFPILLNVPQTITPESKVRIERTG